MTAPLIGVTANFQPDANSKFGTIQVGESYIQALLQAGALPVIIPVGLSEAQVQAVFNRLDGVLLTGGADVDPARFGGQPHARVYGIDARRDSIEIQLARLAAGGEKPFMGICRGIQVINVALGGTLYTDIGDQLDQPLRHDWYPDIPRNYLAHPVTVMPDSQVGEILGGANNHGQTDGQFEVPVNSLHHQGIQRLADALRPVAFAPDQLIEAVEIPGHDFGIAVQWHPEWLQEHAAQRALFSALVQAAARGQNNGKNPGAFAQ